MIMLVKVVSSNPAHGELYSIQHYVIKFISDLRQVSDFFPFTLVSSTNKTDRHDITEILFKVVLNTINLTLLCINGEQSKSSTLVILKTLDIWGNPR